MSYKTIWMPLPRMNKKLNLKLKHNMSDAVIRMVFGYVMVIVGWAYNQVSETIGGVIDKGFDAGLSIGLLVIGLIVLGWYHYKYQEYSREVISKLVDDKDEKSEEYHKLSLQQISLSQEQIQTNRELKRAVENLERVMERSRS